MHNTTEDNYMDIITAEQAAEAAKGLTFEKVWAALMENRLQMQEAQKEMRETYEQTQKEIKESQQRTEKTIADLSKQLGGLGNSIGDLTESMFSGALWEKFAEYGIPVSAQSERRKFSDGKRVIAEADIFIENGEYAIPVEIKTKLTVKNVDEHIERIEAIRRHFDAKGDKRKLLGAVAGGVVPENVFNYAQGNGLFVLVQSGDSVTIADMPKGFKAREW